MNKKAVLAVFTLISLLFTMFATQFIVVPVEAGSGTIYVDAKNIGDPSEDGSSDHPFDKIQEGIDAASSGDTVFVYNGTYYEHVFVNKSLTLIGEDADTTIINASEVLGKESVIECYNASNVKISGFTIRQRVHGIDLNYCNNVSISGNIVTGNTQYGIFVENSRNITISDNMVLNNGLRGIYLRSSKNNTVSNNTVSEHSQYGIYLYLSASNNVISDNTISNNDDRGIWLNDAHNNVISDNTISKNYHGLYIEHSKRNTLRNNNMTGNRYNFVIDGSLIGHYTQDIDPSNIVDGKPVYYWVNQHNKQVPSDAGYVALVNSANITVKDQDLAKNKQGVLIAYTTNSTIMNVNASYNYIGIHILGSRNNRFKSNILTNNQKGIELKWDSHDNNLTHNTLTNNDWGIFSAQCNNTIYHNNFISNTKQVQSFTSSNVWDDGYPSGGNYWSDYMGEDANSDGIGDTPYLIPEDNPDNHPLMTPVIVADQIIIDERCDVGSLQTIAFHAIWAHNSSNVVSGGVHVNSKQYLTNSTGWISFDATRDTVGKLVLTVTSFGSFYVIWDRIQIVEGGSSRAETTITETETIWFKAIYEYDGSVFDGTMGTLYVNGSAMIWSTVNERWEYNCAFNTSGTRVFKISGVSDGQYGLTTINDLAGAQSITWRVEEEEETPFWAQWWFWTIMGIVIAMAVTAIYFLRKRKPPTPTPHSPSPPPVRGIAAPIDKA